MSISFSQYLLYLQYMLIGVAMVALFACTYLRITPIAELTEIKKGNLACALSFGGALIGFCLALSSSIAHSLNIPDFMLWGLAAAIIQILAYFVATRLVAQASEHLANNNTAVGALFAAISMATGLLNAACLT